VVGVTFVTRFRVLPFENSKRIGGNDPGVDIITFIPPASRRAQVGIGFVDPAFTELETLVPIGYYAENALGILGDLAEVVNFAEGIDTTQFHSVWISSQTDPNDSAVILVRAFVDGSTDAVELSLVREGFGGASGDPEDLQDNPEWAGAPELSINLGFAGTPSVGALQFDYVAATFAGAFDPVAAVGVESWEVY